MTDITKEIDAMADKMEKSSQAQTFSLDLIKSTVLKLGPEGLKKAVSKLSSDQKELLKEVLGEMKKSSQTLEPVSDSTPAGDASHNASKPSQLEPDEDLSEEARKRRQMEHRNQGGTPIEGWEGQIIKSEAAENKEGKKEDKEVKKLPMMKKGEEEEVEKGGSGSGRRPVNPAAAGIESMKNLASRAAESKHVSDKFNGKKEEKKSESGEAMGEALDDKKKLAKDNLKKMMSRMQARKMEKSTCVAALVKSLGLPEDKVAQVWDLLAKGDVLPEKGNPEGSQSSVPSQMKGDEGGSVNDPEDPSVPKYKDKAAKKAPKEAAAGGEPHTTADEGEQPPKPLKKSDGYFHDEGEPVYFAKSEANPFAVRTIKPNAAYTVDQMIEALATSQADRLSKSTFDYEDDTEVLAKSDDPTEVDVVEANAKKKAASKQNEAQEIRGIKVDEKLSRIEGHSGPKMPFVKKMKKSVVDELIEKSLDMDQGTFDLAQANRTSQASGGFLVKSFDQNDMDALFGEQDMFKTDKAKNSK